MGTRSTPSRLNLSVRISDKRERLNSFFYVNNVSSPDHVNQSYSIARNRFRMVICLALHRMSSNSQRVFSTTDTCYWSMEQNASVESESIPFPSDLPLVVLPMMAKRRVLPVGGFAVR